MKSHPVSLDSTTAFSDSITDLMRRSTIVEALVEAVALSTDNIQLRGVAGSFFSIVLTACYRQMNRQFVIICPDAERAKEIWADADFLLGSDETLFIGDRSTQLQKVFDNLPNTYAENIDALRSLIERSKRFVVTDISSACSPFPEIETIKKHSLRLRPDNRVPQETLLRSLAFGGFEQVDFVGATGEYAVRGGIVDVFPVGIDNPLRIEYFGDEIESIREFDIMNQRSTATLSEALFVTSLFLNTEEETVNRIPSFLTSDAVLVLDGLEALTVAAETIDPGFISQIRSTYATVLTSTIEQRDIPVIQAGAESQPSINGSIQQLLETIRSLNSQDIIPALVTDSKTQSTRLEDLLHSSIHPDDNDTTNTRYTIQQASLTAGFIHRELRFAVLTEHQIFNRRRAQRKTKKGIKGLSLRELRQLRPGDYVVHTDKGIGRFVGFKTITVHGGLQETAQIIYADDDVLYVNLQYINRLQKYSSEEGATPVALSKLGSGAWERTKDRTKRRLKDTARDLIRLYAKRKMTAGYSFSEDTQWQKELEASFMFEDTPDQLQATEDVKRDMENSAPMDRLVCGDVGYGKTEVAVRAAFKAVTDGKQVAVLVPTTILAEQHYNTFKDRLTRYAVSVETLSRFKTKKAQIDILKKLERGSVDVLIGTHRLLSKDVFFKNLGLLIIDEEHRFGVAAKEKLRQLREAVDTLTMTATPIPRTLNFSLLGARDLSVMETAPKNRLPIITHIVPFKKEVITEAIQRELRRGGQVFVVNDTVSGLDYLADTIRSYIPGVRVGTAHGQLKASELENALLRFIERKTEVLVTTKIIESGLDIPNANTILIHKAHHFGLAELYQLRGRVGRSNNQAYAYLLVPPEAKLTRNALKRLQAIEEFTELGTGFQLAMRDLEIRGTGNLLGAEQSGFITEIGFELYMSMLEEAVQELKDEEFAGLFDEQPKTHSPRTDVVIELGLDAYLPQSYVNSATERFDIYRRLYNCELFEDIDAIEAEIRDRFGTLPTEAINLLFSARLRLIAARIRLSRVQLDEGQVNITLPPEDDKLFYEIHFQPLMHWVQQQEKRIQIEQNRKQLRIIVRNITTAEDVKPLLEEMETALVSVQTEGIYAQH